MSALAAGGSPGIAGAEPTQQKDLRVVADRLRGDTFLNAVGAVWAHGVDKSGGGYPASTGTDPATGFLIDRCHVLTNLHVAYAGADVVNPPLAQPVAFAVGQTESDADRGALQGLKFLMKGWVVAHGTALVLDGRVHDPADDWAVIRLAGNVDGTITPLPVEAVDPGQLPKSLALSTAGYPSDHRRRRGDGFKLKDLWKSEGGLVEITPVSSTAALIQTTIQATPGNSGGPIFADIDGRRHVVIGITQGIRGNGIDVSAARPNVGILLTPDTVLRIIAARAQDPCR